MNDLSHRMEMSSVAPGAGRVVVLNGVPRAGKSSIARAIQDAAGEPWLVLGADASIAWLPDRLRPGVGLRPGGERAELEDAVVLLSQGLFSAVAAQARLGFDVVVDCGLHDSYSKPLHLAQRGAAILAGLSVLFVGVLCSAERIWQRRAATWDQHRESADASLLEAVERWPRAVHVYDYDLEVDTTALSPEECAHAILARLSTGPDGTAFAALASA